MEQTVEDLSNEVIAEISYDSSDITSCQWCCATYVFLFLPPLSMPPWCATTCVSDCPCALRPWLCLCACVRIAVRVHPCTASTSTVC